MSEKIEELQKEIEAEKKARENKALQQINAILTENNCELITELVWREGQAPIVNKLIVAK